MGLGEWIAKLKGVEAEHASGEIVQAAREAVAAFKASHALDMPKRIRSAPARDEFAAWRDDPVTQFVFAALRNAAEAQKRGWTEASWDTANANPQLLTELRTRADAYLAMQEGDYEAFCDMAGVEPEA